jgi:uncharacterized protein (TIGR00375 family)
MTLENIAKWCEKKGIDVVATADFTHPFWFKEIKNKLIHAENGLYVLPNSKTRFILGTEISNIFKRDKCYKVHSLVFFPHIEDVERFNETLAPNYNISSDGRPILGMDIKDLLKITFQVNSEAMFIPAHIWTPHFSIFGAKSGFNSLSEAFGDLSRHITALETGLSSDPPMNWQISEIENIPLVSNSDAHSLRKLGREANIFDTNMDYYSIRKALITNCKKSFLSTIEFFPEEGKYHLDGHRDCGVVLEPHESILHNNICPKCQKPLTIGVLNRTTKLIDQDVNFKPQNKRPFQSIIPLEELISSILNRGVNTKSVQEFYENTVRSLGSEFFILLEAPISAITKYDEKLAQIINKMRQGKIKIQAGYDGKYGKIEIS